MSSYWQHDDRANDDQPDAVPRPRGTGSPWAQRAPVQAAPAASPAATAANGAAAGNRKDPSAKVWQYKDQHGYLQGPFSTTQILKWFKEGWYDKDLVIRTTKTPDAYWTRLELLLDDMRAELASTQQPSPPAAAAAAPAGAASYAQPQPAAQPSPQFAPATAPSNGMAGAYGTGSYNGNASGNGRGVALPPAGTRWDRGLVIGGSSGRQQPSPPSSASGGSSARPQQQGQQQQQPAPQRPLLSGEAAPSGRSGTPQPDYGEYDNDDDDYGAPRKTLNRNGGRGSGRGGFGGGGSGYGSGNGGGRGAFGGHESRPGDWNCSVCGKSNFSRRGDCFSCNAPKDSQQWGAGSPAAAGDGAYGRGSNSAHRGAGMPTGFAARALNSNLRGGVAAADGGGAGAGRAHGGPPLPPGLGGRPAGPEAAAAATPVPSAPGATASAAVTPAAAAPVATPAVAAAPAGPADSIGRAHDPSSAMASLSLAQTKAAGPAPAPAAVVAAVEANDVGWGTPEQGADESGW